jgi:predicted AAA+ superfamily ATPase
MDILRKRHRALINNVETRFKRDIINELPWGERLIGIKGARGIGKTTLLLQYIKDNYNNSNDALYVSLDDPYFFKNNLLSFADDFVAKGGTHLFIDEVHKYDNWAIEIKKIYDYNPALRVVFTGSSLLEIINSKADLSRRALTYKMQGLSFREFLAFKYNISIEKLKLTDILSNHEDLAFDISTRIKPLKYFMEYLQAGYFPFVQDNIVLYHKRLNEIINLIIDIELPSLKKIDISKTHKIKQLLSIISQSVPFKPNISTLANKINISRNSLLDYIYALVDADILMSIHRDSFGISLLQKPDKLFINNTNYMYSLGISDVSAGSLRETFFLNQLSQNHKVTYPKQGDFLVDEKYLFEIGGKNKSGKQIMGIDNSFIVSDDIAYGVGNKIPLWLFGLLY